jgi:hypothetical protein
MSKQIYFKRSFVLSSNIVHKKNKHATRIHACHDYINELALYLLSYLAFTGSDHEHRCSWRLDDNKDQGVHDKFVQNDFEVKSHVFLSCPIVGILFIFLYCVDDHLYIYSLVKVWSWIILLSKECTHVNTILLCHLFPTSHMHMHMMHRARCCTAGHLGLMISMVTSPPCATVFGPFLHYRTGSSPKYGLSLVLPSDKGCGMSGLGAPNHGPPVA